MAKPACDEMREIVQFLPASIGKSTCTILVAACMLVAATHSISYADVGHQTAPGPGDSRPSSSILKIADAVRADDKSTTAPISSSIEFEDGRLSVSLKETPLRSALDEISRHSGIEIRFIGEYPASTASLQFNDLPAEKGLRYLLRDVNTIFIYAHALEDTSHEGRLDRVLILPKGESNEINDGVNQVLDSTARISEQIRNAVAGVTNPANSPASTDGSYIANAIDELAPPTHEING